MVENASACGTGVCPEPRQLGFNLDQNLIAPGEDVSVTLWHRQGELEGRVRVERLDPASFARDPESPDVEQLLRLVAFRLEEGNWRWEDQVLLTNLPAGLLRVGVEVDGETLGSMMLQVTRMGVHFRGGGENENGVAWVVRLDDASPVAGARLHDATGVVGTTDANGILQLGQREGDELVAVAGDQVAASSLQFWWGGSSDEHRIAIQTDRPLYRPGHTVHVKTVAWEHDGTRFTPPAEEGAEIELQLTFWNPTARRTDTLARETLTLNAFGTAHLDIELPADARLGRYRLEATWENTTQRASFDVEEYRLPSFRVDVAPSPATIVAGEPQDFLVSAQRYYGEPLDTGEVAYRVEPLHRYFPHHGPHPLPVSPNTGAPSDHREEGTLQLQEDGTARLSVDAPPGSYRVVFDVTAITGERVTQQARLTVHPAAVHLSIHTDRWSAPINETFPVTLTLMDLQGEPASGDAEVTLTQRDRVQEDDRWNWREKELWRQNVSIEDGEHRLPVEFSEPGRYTLEARTQDGAGRETTATRSIWAWDRARAAPAADRLTLIAEEEEVGLGAPLRFQVASPDEGPVLVTLESGQVLDAQVAVPAEGGFVEFAQPPGLDVSRVHVHATQLTIRESTLRPSVATDRETVTIREHPRGLDVTMTTDRDIYEDGETARILVEVKDWQGHGVPAEVALVMVDQALLDLATVTPPDPLEQLFPDRFFAQGQSSWDRWDHRIFGHVGGAGAPMAPVAATDAVDADVASFDAPPAELNVREDFRETGLWLPEARTGSDGVLRVEATLPDTLTEWRLQAHAVSQDGRVGLAEERITTRKDLVADLFAPRFLVAGDIGTVQATVANHAGGMRDVQVLLETEGTTILGAPTRTLTLAPGATGLVSFPVEAETPGTGSLTFYAWTPTDPPLGDALRIPLPIKPYGVESQESKAGRGEASVVLEVPEGTAEGTGQLEISLSPTMMDAAVDALPYLTGFPYGCVEQVMSRFLPTVSVAQAVEVMGQDPNQVDPELDEKVHDGLRRIYDFQHDDGAWGWWHNDASNPYITAYVVFGLAMARDAGYEVDEQVLGRGAQALAELTAETPEGPLRAYQLYALSLADPSLVSEVPEGDGAAELALGALVAAETGEGAVASRLIEQLRGLAVHEDGRVYWQENGEGWTRHGITSDTMLTALALRAILAVDGDDPWADEAALWLLENRAGRAWATTKDTAETVFSLVEHARVLGLSDVDLVARVLVDGEEVAREHYTSDDLWRPREPVRVDVEPGAHDVEILTSGEGTIYWSATARYFETGDPIPEREGPYRFTREILNDDGEPVTTLKAGEEATVRVSVEATRELSYVLVESPLPAGVEVVQEEGSFFRGGPGHRFVWSYMEARDDRVSFSASRLGAGQERVFEYRIHAVFPGEYQVLPVRAEAMYDPTAVGHASGQDLRIEPGPQLQLGRMIVRDALAHESGDRYAVINLHPVGEVSTDVRVHEVDADGSRQELSRVLDASGEVWHLKVAVPQEAFRLQVTAGDTSTLVRWDPAEAGPQSQERFAADHEDLWGDGPVANATSSLAEDRMETDFIALSAGHSFQSVPEDVEERGSVQDDGVRWIPSEGGFAFLLAILAVLGVVRRRLRAGASG